MEIINIYEAKTQLSKLVERVEKGEKIIIGKAGVPKIELSPFRPDKKPREFGALNGQCKISDDFDELPEEMMAAFYGEENENPG